MPASTPSQPATSAEIPDLRRLLYLFIPTTFRSLFPIDFLALTLLALDPLSLGEVEPKRGRGQAQSTAVQFVSALTSTTRLRKLVTITAPSRRLVTSTAQLRQIAARDIAASCHVPHGETLELIAHSLPSH